MDDAKSKRLHDTLKKFVGQRVAIMCARFMYRGVLSEANEDHVVLANSLMVEVSGRAMDAQATTEDPIGGAVIISNLAIEIVFQPNWAFHELPSEGAGATNR